ILLRSVTYCSWTIFPGTYPEEPMRLATYSALVSSAIEKFNSLDELPFQPSSSRLPPIEAPAIKTQ
ncbi:hypothetical protein, partial [endosymbiont of Lamellibrachia barhami]|uniref:hypothetical protein n=1 Tax=endosymbiont of Lamellibrachia barhami TaxID=205975 RepID=UPI001C4AD4FC